MSLSRNLLAAALIVALAGAATGVVAGPAPERAARELAATIAAAEAQTAGDTAATLAKSGHDAIERKRHEEAYRSFVALEKELRRSKGSGIDGAIYWQAYTLAAQRRLDDAGRAVARLEREFPQSRWVDDARALVASANPGAIDRAARDPGGSGRRADEAEVLMAIDALLTTGNPKAVPLLERVIGADHSDKVKERAMFVLTQIDPAAADRTFARILSGTGNDRLKREAIRAIAVGGNRASHERLLEIYRGNGDARLRRSVIDAWLVSDRGDLVREAARTEADPKIRQHAINTLGAMGDVDSIRALLPSLKDERSQRAAMHAFGIAGAAEALAEVANGDWPVDMREEAVQSLGMVSSKKAGPLIVAFYRPNQPIGLRKAAVRALMMHGDGKRLTELYRVENDPSMKRELLQAIAVSDSDGVLDLVDEVLK